MKINITDVYLDLGASRHGADMGAFAMHEAGVVAALKTLSHDVVAHNGIAQIRPEATDVGNPSARFLDPITDVCSDLADGVDAAMGAGHFPLVLGGDHSQAIGTISGLTRHFKSQRQTLGVLWVDAHADMNTPETSPSGNVHGMPLATLLGHGCEQLTDLSGPEPAIAPEHVVLFGVRDIDPTEQRLVDESGVRVFTMREVRARGVGPCLAEAMTILSRASAGIHLSYDLDSIDPDVAPGVGTPVPGGLSMWDAVLLCQVLAQSGKLTSMEMVELNPSLDTANQTGQLAVWLVRTALGDRGLHAPAPHRICNCGRPFIQ